MQRIVTKGGKQLFLPWSFSILKRQSSQWQDSISTNRVTIQQLLEKITENTNNLPPSIYTIKCCDLFKKLKKNDKQEFFNILQNDFNVDRVNAVKEAKEYIKLGKSNVAQLQYNLEPKYNLVFDRIHQLPNGLKFLADMRADLLDIMGHRESELHQQFSTLERDVRTKIKKHVIGCLKLERITWQNSSAELLEKICTYEAVHAVKDWKDIKRRLGPDRRVYAFFENNIPNEPLVFVHVALVPDISSSVQAILNEVEPSIDELDTTKFKCAICYSITTQQGLGGINLGNYLIKQVVKDLKRQYPLLETFATLSPMPGYKKWLLNNLEIDPSIQSELSSISDIKTKLDRFNAKDQAELKEPLMKLCARYILTEKRLGKNALDPVANFHLRNGACAHQIHWQADTSEKGLKESFGIMINYNYIADQLENNHQHYLENGTITVSEPEKDGWLSTTHNNK